MFHLRRMPPEPRATSGSLGDETYANLVAYLLQSNGHAPAESALPSDTDALSALTIPLLEGMDVDLDAPVIGAPGDSELLTRLSAVTNDVLRDPPVTDWLQWGRTYDGQNFSPLTQITRENVQDLRPAWRVPLRGGTSMPTPLVHDGVMFLQTMPDTVLALDGSNGDILWRHQYTPTSRSSQKMGIALHGDKVLVPTSDLHVLALSVKSGELNLEPRDRPGHSGADARPIPVAKRTAGGRRQRHPGGGGELCSEGRIHPRD